MSAPVKSHKDLVVWQKAIDLVAEIYQVTEQFPREEIFGLTSQMRRCAVSIASNIAGGRNRGGKKEFVAFLRIAYGSGAELETQLIICKRLPKLYRLKYQSIDHLLEEVMKILYVMIKKLSTV